MPILFDFINLKKLVDIQSPSAIIVVDTNVLLDNPEFSQWSYDLSNPIFVLAYSTISELAKLKDKKGQPSQEKASAVIRALVRLSDQGPAVAGIHLEGGGWLISVLLPPKEVLSAELDKMGSVREAIHEADTTLLVLHRELNRAFPKIPVVSLTGDQFYTFFASELGLLVYQSQSFPLEVAKWLSVNWPKKAVNMDKELAEAIQRLDRKKINVKLTLINKRLDRDYDFGSDDSPRRGALIAEGEGVLHQSVLGVVGFIWKLLYKPMTSLVLADHPSVGEADIYEGHSSNIDISPVLLINYLGREQEVPESIRDGLASKLCGLADPILIDGALPTLQSPVCTAEFLMKLLKAVDLIRDEKEGQPSSDDSSKNKDNSWVDRVVAAWNDPHVFKSYDDFHDYLAAHLSKVPPEQVSYSIDKIMNVWNIGHTIEFTLPLEDMVVDNAPDV